MAKIERLIIDSYRGATDRLELEFDKRKDMVLLFGENGTGKTTIVDALDAIGNLSKGSLEDRSSTKARNHLPTIGKEPKDVRIELKAGAKTWVATLNSSKIQSTPAPLPKIRVLRRSKLLKLIEAQPAKRYEELRRFIEMDGVQHGEDELNKAHSAANEEINDAARRKVQSESKLEEWWQENESPGQSAIEWATELAEKDTKELSNEIERLRVATKAISLAMASQKSYEESLVELEEAKTALKGVEAEIKGHKGLDAKQSIDLSSILAKVASYLSKGSHPDICPVCEQPKVISELRQELAKRREALKAFGELGKKKEKAIKNVELAVNKVEDKTSGLIDTATKLLDLSEVIQFLDLNIQLDKLTNEKAVELINHSKQKEQELSQREKSLSETTGLQVAVRTELKSLAESNIALAKGEEVSKLLYKAYECVRVTRITYTQDVLNEIADECNRLYEIIHPGEALELSRLELDTNKRRSLLQYASFEGYDDVPPQAYFSESHLDTLGFCFWLALAKRECPNKDAILVLDDVFTSVDAQHINRIAQLIVDESEHFANIVVTTHQRLWRDFYRYQQGPGYRSDLIELQSWSMSKGISNYKNRLAVEVLAESIEAMPFDRQNTASKAGILLEAILDHLALQYRCRVARSHDNSYTLGELMDGTKSLFDKLEMLKPLRDQEGNLATPVQHESTSPKSIFTKLRSIVFIRNQVGAHFNVNGLNIPDQSIKDFAEVCVQLAHTLSCDQCGQVPGKDTGTHFKCSCSAPKDTRMVPLRS